METHRVNQIFLNLAANPESLKRVFRVAGLVGIVLNIINNPSLFQLSFEGMNIYRVLLTFIVPFCVSLYSSVLANRKNCDEKEVKLTQSR